MKEIIGVVLIFNSEMLKIEIVLSNKNLNLIDLVFDEEKIVLDFQV